MKGSRGDRDSEGRRSKGGREGMKAGVAGVVESWWSRGGSTGSRDG